MKTILRFSKGYLFWSHGGEPLAALVIDGRSCCIGALKNVSFISDSNLSRVETENYVYVLVEGEGE